MVLDKLDPTKQRKVALALLDDNRTEPMTAAIELAIKLLSNIVSAPENEKFRTVRTTNLKIRDSLWSIRGGKQLLLSAGFKEVGDTIVMEDPLDVERIQSVVQGARELLDARLQGEAMAKVKHAQQVRLAQEAAADERQNMMLGISDDAATRREPGWTAKVASAAAKGGTAITTATDIGAAGR